jgi:hypothetical protein
MTISRADLAIDTGKIVDDLNDKGIVCIERFFSRDWLSHAQQDVRSAIERHGERYFSVVLPGNAKGTAASELIRDERLRALLRSVTEAVCEQPNAEEIYNVLRVIAGPDGSKGSLEFHYDASVISALAPVFMPEHSENSGALVTFANRRPLRRFVLANVIEKIIMQNRFYRQRQARVVYSDPDKFTQYLVPGNLYLFWGYRTFHGNLPCAPHSLRATILLHYGNPHGNSILLKGIRAARRLVEAVRRRKSE